MKRTSTLSIALPLSLAALTTMFARTQLLELWSGQSMSSPTSVSLTVIASAGSSSSVSSAASSSSSAASSSGQSSAASSEGDRGPQGRYHYSEELTMERLIPLLKKRFLQPAAPPAPTLEPVPPYYKPLRTFPRRRISLERDLLRFGEQMRADAEGLFLWPQQISAGESLHFFPWGDVDAWRWENPFLGKEEPSVPELHAAADAPHWLWAFGSPGAEPWLWLLFLLLILLILLFSRRILDRIVDLLVYIKKKSEHWRSSQS